MSYSEAIELSDHQLLEVNAAIDEQIQREDDANK
ncbi:hypothetical protein JOD44_001757 [Salimicrobium jeotgali]|nr:hypothetical protein [Salimicrobium jeotgali]